MKFEKIEKTWRKENLSKISWSKISGPDISWIWNFVCEWNNFWFEIVKINFWNHSSLFGKMMFRILVFKQFLRLQLYAHVQIERSQPELAGRHRTCMWHAAYPDPGLWENKARVALYVKFAISTSYIELVKVKFFWYCWVFFLEFSNFRSNVINLMNQYHHLDLIVTKWIFKRFFCKIHIVNMIPLLNQVGNIGLRSFKLERAVMMLYEFTSWATMSIDVSYTCICM